MASKPRVLVLGGLGYIGKLLVDHIVKNELASKVRVVDKVMLEMARLSKQEEELFSKVEVFQANLNDSNSTARAFTSDEGDFNYVFNLAGVTKLSQSEEVYKQGITDLSITVAKEAAKHKTEKYVCVSTTDVYKPSNKGITEDDERKPATGIGKAKLEAENALKGITGLNLVVVRPAAYVYGVSDVRGLAPRLCIAAVYRKLNEKLEYPQWFEDLKMPTVHVLDVVKALWHVAVNAAPGSAYNVVDKNETDQKKLNVLLEKLFGIKTGHLNLLKSEAMKLLSIESILSDINGENIKVWLDLLNEAKLENSPLSPYLDSEVLQTNSYVVNGSAIESIGFSYSYPTITEEALREQVNYVVKEGWFPPNYLQ